MNRLVLRRNLAKSPLQLREEALALQKAEHEALKAKLHADRLLPPQEAPEGYVYITCFREIPVDSYFTNMGGKQLLLKTSGYEAIYVGRTYPEAMDGSVRVAIPEALSRLLDAGCLLGRVECTGSMNRVGALPERRTMALVFADIAIGEQFQALLSGVGESVFTKTGIDHATYMDRRGQVLVHRIVDPMNFRVRNYPPRDGDDRSSVSNRNTARSHIAARVRNRYE